MQVILYIPILILSIVSAFFIFGKMKMIFWGSNTLDLGLGIIGAWFFIFFICVVIWSTIFVYLGIPILIIGAILLGTYFFFNKKNGNATGEESVGQPTSENIDEQTTPDSANEQ